jgi:hypothetical protein
LKREPSSVGESLVVSYQCVDEISTDKAYSFPVGFPSDNVEVYKVPRDFAYFLAALWREWKVFLTGGSIVGALSLWNLAGRKPIPQNVNWLILGLTFVLAAFAAWRKEWIDSGKGFTTVAPAELIRLFASGTKVLGETLVKPYIGKRLRVRGTVYNIENNGFGNISYVFLSDPPVFVALWIPSWKMGPFMVLPKGTIITVVGRINSVYDSGIRLTNCTMAPTEDEVIRQSVAPQSPTRDLQSPPPSQV